MTSPASSTTTKRRKRTKDPTTVGEYRSAVALEMTEAALQAHIVADARSLGVRDEFIYHTYDSRRSQIGFPDLLILHNGRALAIECKSEKHGTQPARLALQHAWLAQFSMLTDVQAYLFKPSDYIEGRVRTALLWLVRREADDGARQARTEAMAKA